LTAPLPVFHSSPDGLIDRHKASRTSLALRAPVEATGSVAPEAMKGMTPKAARSFGIIRGVTIIVRKIAEIEEAESRPFSRMWWLFITAIRCL
jgi:hypothetical protein